MTLRCAARLALSMVLAAPWLVGCRTPDPRAPAEVQARAEQRAAEKQEDTTPLDAVQMSRPQREQVDALVTELREDLGDYDDVRLRVIDLVVEQVERGEIDRPALDPLVDEMIAEWELARLDVITFADALHAELSPSQRRRLVVLLNGGDEERSEDEEQAEREERISKLLDLNAGQKTRLYPGFAAIAVRNWGAVSKWRSGRREFKEAFVEDDFEAAEMVLLGQLPMRTYAEAVYDALELTLEILDSEQEKTLAALIDTRMR